MKVVTGETMQAMDHRAIHEMGVSGLTLMEAAGRSCAEAIASRFGEATARRALIVAGKGNNGGDGYVIARYLSLWGWETKVLALAPAEEVVGDAAANLALVDAGTVIFADDLARHAPLFREATLIVDALLGTGVKSAVGGRYAEAIALINGAGLPVVAVDIPSGIDAGTGRVLGCAVRADLTVSFALPKLGNVLFPGAEYGGELVVTDIGMPDEVVAKAPGGEFLDRSAARALLIPRPRTAHKGSAGHTLIVAGSTGKTGAAALAAASAVRSGGGLVTLAVPEAVHPVLEAKITEAMTLAVPDRGRGYLPAGALALLLAAARGKQAVALGPGLGAASATWYLVRRLLEQLPQPVVLDADGVNALGGEPELLLLRRDRVTVLTPHPGEMARLLKVSVPEVEADRIATACRFSTRYGVHLILKGAATVVAAPDGSYAVNGSGNPGMASGGMGDLLTGIVASLAGQGYPPFDACRLGVFLHGFSADLVARERGTVGMNATDVQERLPAALALLGTDQPQDAVPAQPKTEKPSC